MLFWRAVVKLFSPLVKLDLQILFELDLTQPIDPRPARVECSIEQATEADLDEILDMQMKLLPPEVVSQLSDEEELQYAQLLRARASARENFARAMRAGPQTASREIPARQLRQPA